MDLGITGLDQIREHEAVTPPTEDTGAEVLLDLGFGSCKLQIQVPERGRYKEAKDLIGCNICTSFVGLTEKEFARLEAEERGTTNGDGPVGNHLKTKIKYLSGSVEAACALGVADGIVDLVGPCGRHRACFDSADVCRVWRNDEEPRSQSHKDDR